MQYSLFLFAKSDNPSREVSEYVSLIIMWDDTMGQVLIKVDHISKKDTI
jgi:hypothetical protein